MTHSHYNYTIKFGVILAVAVLLTASTVNAESKRTSTNPITKTFKVEDQTITLMIPEFAVSGNDGAIGITLKVIVDVTALKGALVAQMNKRWKYDECGERFETHGATVRPGENGQLNVGITARAQRWKCVKTKIPKVRWEIKRFGPIKTKVPQFYSEMKTAKTKLVSQSIHLEALVRAVLKDDTIAADVNVTKAMPSGLAKHFVKVFGLHGKIKKVIQSKIEERLRGRQFRLPEQVREYKVKILDVAFLDLGKGRLGLHLSANGSITNAQIEALIKK